MPLPRIRPRMLLLAITFGIGPSLWGQVVIEQWGCDRIVAATNANPVVLTCNTPHGYSPGATWNVQLYGGTRNWGALNTWAHTQLLTSLQTGDRVAYVNEAAPQETPGTVGFGCGHGMETATVSAKTATSLTVNRSSPQFHYLNSPIVSRNCANQVWLNYNRPHFYKATATSATTFSIPVNSSSFGRFSDTVYVRRTTGIPRVYGTDYDGMSNTVGLSSAVANGVFTEIMPAVTNPADPKDVVRSLGGTGMGLFMGKVAGSSATVKGGVATVQIEPWRYQAERPLKAGTFVYLDGFSNDGLNNGFIVSSAAPAEAPSQFQIPVALADGNYSLAGTGARFGIPRAGLPNPDFEPADDKGTWSFPGGYLQGFVKSGKWDPEFNRMQMWVKLNRINIQRRSDNGYIGTVGTYEKRRHDRVNAATPQYDEHWYHYLNGNLYDDVWVLVTLNQHPTHQVGSTGHWDWGVDPTMGFVGYPPYLGEKTHYFDGMGRFYFDLQPQTVTTFAGSSVSLGQITLFKTAAEPDSSVFSVAALWSPARFSEIGGCRAQGQGREPACSGKKGRGPGFEVSWNVPPFTPLTYEVRRSASSMKAAGFSSGICNGGTKTCSAAHGDIVKSAGDQVTIQWASSDTKSRPAATYIAIRPSFPVMGISGKGSSPIWITTHVSTDMAAGDHVSVSGVLGNTAANQANAAIVETAPVQSWFRYDPTGTAICAMTNGSPIQVRTCAPHRLTEGAEVRVDQAQGNRAANGWFKVHVVDATTVQLLGSKGDGNYSGSPYAFIHGPGMLSQIAAASGKCAVTTTAPHRLKPGMWVMVTGSASPALGQAAQAPEMNWRISDVPDATHLQFACPKVPDGTYAQDFNRNYYLSMKVYPAIAIAGTGNGAWTTGGTVVSTEDRKNFTEIRLADSEAVAAEAK